MSIISTQTMSDSQQQSQFFDRVFDQQLEIFMGLKHGKPLSSSSIPSFNFIFLHSSKPGSEIKIYLQTKKSPAPTIYLYSTLVPEKIEGGLPHIIEVTNKANVNTKQFCEHVYYFKQSSKHLCCRIDFKSMKQIDSSLRCAEFIMKTLNETSRNFIELYEKIRQHQKNYKKIFRELKEDIKSLQTNVQKEIVSRSKSNIPPSYTFTMNSESPNTTISQTQNTEQDERFNFVQLEYKYRKQLDFKQADKAYKILRKIKILEKEVDESWSPPKSAFGRIVKWSMKFQIEDTSIEGKIAAIEESSEELKTNEEGEIIEKTVKNQNKGAMASFKNQQMILKYLRNQYQSNIASFYMENIESSDFKIFTQFYEKRLCDSKIRVQKFFEIIKSLAQATNFLQKWGVLHRDLKPENIMITNNFVPKMIDFGSGVILNGETQYGEKIDKILRTTRGYNIVGSNTSIKYMECDEFDQHKYFDMYAFGKIINQIFDENQIQKSLKHPVLIHYSWLYQHLTIQNPENRINGRQAILYSILLLKLWQAGECL